MFAFLRRIKLNLCKSPIEFLKLSEKRVPLVFGLKNNRSEILFAFRISHGNHIIKEAKQTNVLENVNKEETKNFENSSKKEQ